ncbi:RNA-binding protein pno1 [Chionoecetes opilio]|uniref:RNA-binding protein pno1 n=1 Tax=Chionoecetes opilio TaxID=41210 RepID=A0A8J5CYP9_CHIOP|nr:RNA-binding protein pno1 [Chionoecetes opilio]
MASVRPKTPAKLAKVVEEGEAEGDTHTDTQTDTRTDTHSPRKRKADDTEDSNMEGIEDAKTARPFFPPAKKEKSQLSEMRKIPVPNNRYTPLKDSWEKLYTPLVEHLKLEVRFNLKTKNVEIRTGQETEDPNSIQKAADFVTAFVYGFDVEDALALIRLDDLYLETFDIKDVPLMLHNPHSEADTPGRPPVSRHRPCGRQGRQDALHHRECHQDRIVLADSRVHILGSFQNIQIARRAICNLILGSPPSKVYGNLKAFAEKVRDRF